MFYFCIRIWKHQKSFQKPRDIFPTQITGLSQTNLVTDPNEADILVAVLSDSENLEARQKIRCSFNRSLVGERFRQCNPAARPYWNTELGKEIRFSTVLGSRI